MKKRKFVKAVAVALILIFIIYTRLVNLSWGLPYPMHPDERNMAMAIQSLRCDFVPVAVDVRRPVDLHDANTVPRTALKDTDGKAALVQPRNPGEAVWFFISNCMNPHFFAYGQMSLYSAFFIVLFTRMFTQIQGTITVTEAVMALRILSAAASMITVFLGYLTLKTISTHEGWNKGGLTSWNFFLSVLSLLVFISSPALIQFAHFGTTESFLMLTYMLLVFLSIKFMYDAVPKDTYVFLSAMTIGLASAAKISSLVFLIIPVILMFRYIKKPFEWMFFILSGLFYTAVILFLFSPHNLISLNEFLTSIRYESDVALGTLEVFYTRSFKYTIPVIYQFVSVFPHALGWPVVLTFFISFFALPWKKRVFNILRLSFFGYFIVSALTYTKWTRFMAPVLPVMILIAGTGIVWTYWKLLRLAEKMYMIPSSDIHLKKEHTQVDVLNLSSAHHTLSTNPAVVRTYHLLFFLIFCILLIPGIAYLRIYEREDVRSRASRWIIRNIPEGSYILSETANVVDIPLDPVNHSLIPGYHPDGIAKRTVPRGVNYDVKSFNFYELDNPGERELLQSQLNDTLSGADYIFIPSRRIFYNHTCYRDSAGGFKKIRGNNCEKLEETYPLVNDYYTGIFEGSLGFSEVARFTSYPGLTLFGKTIIEFPDEHAEETWTVFDHPVIRIFKRG